MAELRELERKLESIDGLREVVSAMRNLAAVYVRRAEKAVGAIRPYTDIVETALRAALERRRAGSAAAGPAEGGAALAVVFASDQGLCGGYNDRIVRAALAYREEARGPLDFIAIGRRAHDLLTLRGVTPILNTPAPTSLEGIQSRIPELAADIFEAYTERGATRMVFIYNDYQSMGRFEETVQPVLPPNLDRLGPGLADRFRYEPILTAPPDELLGALIEEYFFVRLCRALLESHCSENGARLLAMTAASGNIDERQVELTQEFQTVRQDSITSELLDVVAGAEALREAV